MADCFLDNRHGLAQKIFSDVLCFVDFMQFLTEVVLFNIQHTVCWAKGLLFSYD